jgi:DNA replication protein DnaC
MTRKNTSVHTPPQTPAHTLTHAPTQDLYTIAMLNHTTIAQLRTLKLNGFADALQQQHEQADGLALSFDERLALLVEREVHARNDRKHARLLQRAGLKYPGASIEDASFEGVRGIDRSALVGLALSTWIERGETVTLAGATGLGKTWLACALAQYACRQGRSVLYLRVPRLAEELRILHGSGGFRRWLQQLAKTDVLVLDDWGTGAIDASTRADLLEIIDDRASQRATIITHQLPIEHWHAWLGDATVADAMLDRLMQCCRRFQLEGESRRTGQAARAAAKRSATKPMTTSA